MQHHSGKIITMQHQSGKGIINLSPGFIFLALCNDSVRSVRFLDVLHFSRLSVFVWRWSIANVAM